MIVIDPADGCGGGFRHGGQLIQLFDGKRFGNVSQNEGNILGGFVQPPRITPVGLPPSGGESKHLRHIRLGDGDVLGGAA